MISRPQPRRAALLVLGCLCAFPAVSAAAAQAAPFIGPFQPNPSSVATTVPANGDVNPYGIVTVPTTIGTLKRGDLLVSNFNNQANQQGTGTTIVQIPRGGNDGNPGDASVFAEINPQYAAGAVPGRRRTHHRARRHPQRVRDRREPADTRTGPRPPPRQDACSC